MDLDEIADGREVDGIELRFQQGEVVEVSARKGEAYLKELVATDEGSRRLGEFAIGTNSNLQRFTRELLFDEKLGGTIHVALGFGFPEAGGKNKSAHHLDLICDMKDGGEIWVDDTLFYRSGEFQI